MAIKTFTTGEVLTASDTNTYLANAGLVYITSASATSGTTLNIDNIFSSSYRSYRIVLDDVRIVSGVTGLGIQLRVGGATNNTTYYNVRQGFDYTTGVAGAAPTANGTGWNIALIVDSSNSAGCIIDIFNPFLTQKTSHASTGTSQARYALRGLVPWCESHLANCGATAAVSQCGAGQHPFRPSSSSKHNCPSPAGCANRRAQFVWHPNRAAGCRQ